MWDIIGAMGTVAGNKALKKIHTEAEDIFHELHRRASNMCCISETRRKSERQKPRTNLKGDDRKTQYRVKDVEPLVERVLSQIETRFTNHYKKALSL